MDFFPGVPQSKLDYVPVYNYTKLYMYNYMYIFYTCSIVYPSISRWSSQHRVSEKQGWDYHSPQKPCFDTMAKRRMTILVPTAMWRPAFCWWNDPRGATPKRLKNFAEAFKDVI
jgi:hypothetical protein